MADDHTVIENDDEGECGLLEIVNEHNEVLGVVLSHTEPCREAPIAEENSSSESETDPNEVPIAEENSSSESETPNEAPIAEENMFSSSESETDTPNYILESSDSEQEQDNIPHIRVPLKNYS